MKIVVMLMLLLILGHSSSVESKNVWDMHNIWIKTYINNKNYNTIINNITITQRKLERKNNSLETIEKLQKKLGLYQSKLNYYQKDSNFDLILKPFKYSIKEITLYDYLFKESLGEIEKLLRRYSKLQKDFDLAKSKLNDLYHQAKKRDKKSKATQTYQEDMEYFAQYSETIEKVHHDLLDSKEKLMNQYQEYQKEVFTQHIRTLTLLGVAYLLYRFLRLIIEYLGKRSKNYEDYKSYSKVLSSIFVSFVLIFLAIRYIDDLAYIFTFLGVIAAALTLAAREIIMSLAGGVYLFFSHMIRVGDRIMVQFGNRHTIGDVVDVTMFQIKLHEVEDYNNLKDVKNVGRTVYVPNSYLFTHVFYNYSLKKQGMIKDLIEFEFKPQSNFETIEKITDALLNEMGIEHSISFTLNALKTGIIAKISYRTNYKEATKNRGNISIKLLKEFGNYEDIVLKEGK